MTPRKDMTTVLMIQQVYGERPVYEPQAVSKRLDFWTAAYQANRLLTAPRVR
jgi:hypothetical protein